MRPFRPTPRLAAISGSAVAVIAVLALGGWLLLFRPGATRCSGPDAPIEQLFTCGPTGVAAANGAPYLIWLVLPDVFPEYLPGPGGYRSLGMIYEDGAERPIGIPVVDIGAVPRAGLNCAFCHTGSYRTAPDATPVVVLGAPGRVDLQGYTRFLFSVIEDPKFNGDEIVAAIQKRQPLSVEQQLLYKTVLVPATKLALRHERARFAYAERNPDQGYGRIDPFNPVKFGPLGRPVDDTIGNSDFEPLWNLGDRTVFHWDGLERSLRETALSGALGSGATPATLEVENIMRLVEWMQTLPAPAYPFPLDAELADAGKPVFDAHCATCHVLGQGRTDSVIPIAEIGTDRHRVDMWGDKDAEAYNAAYADYPWGLHEFQNVDGYVAVPLDGIWMRAPYLHNGSVPSLTDLLKPVAERPQRFYRGYDVYDPEAVGFVSDVAVDPGTGQPYFLYDTSLAGNSNEGHLYGLALTDAEKRALVEYLKTQ